VRVTIQREREHELRYDLWMIRDAIDRYKDAADRVLFKSRWAAESYPPDLETLVTGVDVGARNSGSCVKFPIDPMTGQAEWGLRSVQDDPTSDSWEVRMSSTFTPSRRARLWTIRNIRTGR